MTFHKVLLKLHLWTGLASAAFLLVLGVTGSIVEWAPEVGRNPRQSVAVPPHAQPLPLSQLLSAIEKNAEGARLQGVNLGLPSDPYSFVFRERGTPGKPGPRAFRFFVVNQYTGQIIQKVDPETVQSTWGNRFMGWTLSLHRNLLIGKNGTLIVNYATLVGMFLILTGIILWWPRKIWWTTKGASWRRFNFDLHSVVGIYSMVFFFIISFTGSMIHWGQIGQSFVKLAGQQTPRIAQPHSKPPGPGVRPLSLDQLFAKADSLPGDRTLSISVPERPTDAVAIRRRSNADQRVIFGALDQFTGEPLMINDPITRPWAVRLVSNARSIHEGTLFGMTGRIIATLASTAVPVMVITGFIIWWRRKLTEWRRKWAASSGRSFTPKDEEDLREDEREDLDRLVGAPEPVQN